MTIKGITTKLRFQEKTYEVGEPLEGLSHEEEASLVDSGVAEYCGIHDKVQKVTETVAGSTTFADLLSVSASNIKGKLSEYNHIDMLEAILQEEKSSKNRKTVIKDIEARIAELEAEAADDREEKSAEDEDEDQDDEDIDDGTSTEIGMDFDPSEAVVDGK